MNTKNSKIKSSVIPLADRVLIRPLSSQELEQKSSFGIIIPETVSSKEKPEQGIVEAVGPGKYEDGKLIQMNVKVGDRVMFSKYGFEEVQVEGEDFYILSESQIFAIIK